MFAPVLLHPTSIVLAATPLSLAQVPPPPDQVEATSPVLEPAEDDLDAIFGTPEDHAEMESIDAGPSVAANDTETAVHDTPAESAPAKGPGLRAKMSAAGLKFNLRVLSSLQFDIDRVHAGERWHREFDRKGRLGRHENRLGFGFSYAPNEHIEMVGDVSVVFLGLPDGRRFDDAASRTMLGPVHIESDAAYLAIYDIAPGLDFKIGRQFVVWGTADKFNPTNNLNPDDLEDRPVFMAPIANQMAVVDYAPLDDKLWFQGVYIPWFFPALLPPSSAEAVGDTDARVPFAEQLHRDQIGVFQRFLKANPEFQPHVTVEVHEPKKIAKSGQYAARVGTTLGNFDASASYFFGFHDIPLPLRVDSITYTQEEKEHYGHRFGSHVHLIYPRMHVWGLDFATSIPFLDDLGLWGEAALILPQQDYSLDIQLPIEFDVSPNDSERTTTRNIVGPTARRKAFVKATFGLDYSLGKHVYLQAQYLRGFTDEFGRGAIGDYLVGGTELTFLGRRLRARIFGVFDVSPTEDMPFSWVLAPEVVYTPPWGYLSVHLGGFAFFGDIRSKFGQLATGSSIVHAKLVGSF